MRRSLRLFEKAGIVGLVFREAHSALKLRTREPPDFFIPLSRVQLARFHPSAKVEAGRFHAMLQCGFEGRPGYQIGELAEG
jgi:hypothetical protein